MNPQPPPQAPRPSSCEHNSTRSESAQASARSGPAPHLHQRAAPEFSTFPPSDLYTLTSMSPRRDNNTLSTWKSRPEERRGVSEMGIRLREGE